MTGASVGRMKVTNLVTCISVSPSSPKSISLLSFDIFIFWKILVATRRSFWGPGIDRWLGTVACCDELVENDMMFVLL